MYSLLVLFFILSEVRAENESVGYDKNTYKPDIWKPVSGPYGDRLQPVKVKDPKPDDNKFYYGANSKPYFPSSYIQGLYTFPYYGYGDVPLWYPHPYPAGLYDGYYIKKENKDYTPVYKD